MEFTVLVVSRYCVEDFGLEISVVAAGAVNRTQDSNQTLMRVVVE
jgi:hypothetical protein